MTRRLLRVTLVIIAIASVAAAAGLRPGRLAAQSDANQVIDPNAYQDLKWRSVGPHRGGRHFR